MHCNDDNAGNPCSTSHYLARENGVLRMATIAAAPGTRFRKTTETEVLPARGTSIDDAKPTPFYDRDWEIVVQSLTKEEWSGHVLRVYRSNEKWERGAGPIDNTFTAPFNEEDIRSRFGGGRYVLWLYGPPKKQTLVGRYQVELEGQPIMNSVSRNGSSQMNAGDNVALEAMRMYANPEFMRMQMDMMRQGTLMVIEMVKNQMPAAQDPLATLRNAKEILGYSSAPPANPDGGLIASITLLKELGLLGSPEKKGITEVLETLSAFKTAGLIPSAVAPKTDLATMFASNIPMLVDRVVTGLQEFRLQREAEVHVMQLQRGQMRPTDQGVITMDPPAAAAASAAPAPAAPATATQVTPELAQAIIAQSHLFRIVAGIRDTSSGGQELFDYLDNAWPEVLDELVKFKKDDLLAFFKSREMQMQYFGCATLTEVADDPRLPKIIEDFLAIAQKNSAPVETVATHAAV